MDRILTPTKLTVRAEGDQARIVGYAAKFYNKKDPGTEYKMGPIRERIAPGAFARAVEEDDVRALFNHDAGLVLGRTASGTLRLEEDEEGLRYEIDVPDTQLGRDVLELVNRGDVSGSSFAFQIPEGGDRIDEDDEGAIRTIAEVELYDVGPVTYPAYSSTEASVRQALLRERLQRHDLDQQMAARQAIVDRDRAYAYARSVELFGQ